MAAILRLSAGKLNMNRQNLGFPALQAFRQWRRENTETINSMSQFIETTVSQWGGKIVGKATDLVATASSIFKSAEFSSASLMGKLKLSWDKIVAEPFGEWWNGKGKSWLKAKVGNIGNEKGSFLSEGILTLLGFQSSGALQEGMTVGQSFAEGFAAGFDGKKVLEAIKNALKGIFSDAATILPGQETSSTAWLSAGLMTAGFSKLGASR